MGNKKTNLLVVLGPTASGKTRLAVALARVLGGEILSADSRQVYRGLDIGSGKDLAEYGTGADAIRYHLVDIVGLDHEFSVFEFQRRCYAAFEEVRSRGNLPILTGGTGLYIEAVLQGYRMVEAPEDPVLRAGLADLPHEALVARLETLKPDLHNTTDLEDRARLVRAIEIAAYSADHPPAPAPEIHPLVLGVRWPRDVLRSRIRTRLHDRLEHGLIEEVQGLLDQGVPLGKLEFLGLEYRHVANYLRGATPSRDELEHNLATAICQFAKRQETWFRRMERRGTPIHWLDSTELPAAMDIIRRHG